MAFDAQQSITWSIPTPLPSTSATNSTYDDWTVDYTGICNVWTIHIDAAEDFDGSRPKTNVFVRGRTIRIASKRRLDGAYALAQLIQTYTNTKQRSLVVERR